MGERQFGPYRLVRQIAVGGMAEIHLAKTKGIAGFEKYVALKMIHPNFAEDEQFIQMLVDEAKIAVQLNHANIAQTFDLGRVGDTYYITMEYVDGADLYKVLRRASEIDIEMPLDVCAFVGKEIASALDHAHRKRDHLGKNLGIVHRDVSPQNVLISFAGEVKLVDFGIAKATMKARQTAVGVIKGKYYYMSPEQAWGENIDYRSDIFSAGIVLYEMITGQMLYLEEDLHRLLDMARKADIAPPSSLRKGVPPQLSKIVMTALAKKKEDRYQSAADFATDLERFLHAYSPVFTGTKVSAHVKKVLGEPQQAPPDYEVEVHEGVDATFTLSSADILHDKEELRDENSVIFRVADLKPKKTSNMPAPRVTRQAEIKDLPPPPAAKPKPMPSVAKPMPSIAKPKNPTGPMPRAPTKPRDANEETREVGPAPPGAGTYDESGLLVPPKPPARKAFDDIKTPPMQRGHDEWQGETHNDVGDLANIGEHTMITGAPTGFLMENASEDGIDATMITGAPPSPDDEPAPDDDEDAPTVDGEDGPTVQRDFREQPRKTAKRGAPPPAALAANIQAPAVSELRKPRASRKTPGAGTPMPNVLQQIVGGQGGAEMPSPRGGGRNEDSSAQTLPERPAPVIPQQVPQQPFPQQPVPPNGGYPQMQQAQLPPHLQQPQYPVQQGYPQYPPQGYPQYPMQQPYPQQQQPQVSPGALYQLTPYGAPAPQPMSITGQMRLFEADELPSMYKVGSGGRYIKLVIAGVLAISVAAGVTFFVIRGTKDMAPSFGTIRVKSVPAGAEVSYDGTRLIGTTPLTIDKVPLGTRHEIKVELARHKPTVESVDIPKEGGDVEVTATMTPVTGKLVVNTQPANAEILIDGQLRGRAPTTINDIDMATAKTIELRLKDYQPYSQKLEWPSNGEIDIDRKLQK